MSTLIDITNTLLDGYVEGDAGSMARDPFHARTGVVHPYTAGYGDESSMLRIHSGRGEHVELDEGCLQRQCTAPGKPVPDDLPINYA